MLFAKKQIGVALALGALVVLGVAFTRPAEEPHKHKNLKILPKDISHEELDKIMDQFKDALGVHCDFCHAQSKDDQKHLDFASDEKPEKNIARNMMRMTKKINKKYFHFTGESQGDQTPAVTCMTCHRGNPDPGKR